MKVQVIYSSLSGCTRRLADGIYNGLNVENKSIHDLKDGTPTLDGDIILFGYWVDKGGPNEEMINLLKETKGKAVGVFCTLAYYCDSSHGMASLTKGIDLVKEDNTVIGSYVCNGALSEDLIERFKKAPAGTHHSSTPESELRWEVMKSHPTTSEINLATERFDERINLYTKFNEQNLTFKSIT